MRTENLDLELVAGRLADVCRVTAPRALLPELQRFFAASGLAAAIARRDSPMLFDWLARVLNYQGVSKGIAAAYLDQHGTISSGDVAAALAAGPSCPKLASYCTSTTAALPRSATPVPSRLTSGPVRCPPTTCATCG
ncbi:hypothetical protein P7D22_04830 [Lichenihabitans sp. Uapishka_5]|uniref:hypothetical protein n=1 Tax=Lichenihabitans sp. Uapishka_5 TaxID=3037302 RepID=UPI0029E82050|nr:hypothetical protein [Lichenihabitans sp. Uapishka_5]MDX7950501.1 hypothetical protein [Lichenihabitans sp. Uapishka_5]